MTSVDWDSPAWKAGSRRGNVIQEIDSAPATDKNIEYIYANKKSGEKVHLNLIKNDSKIAIPVVLGTKSERSFDITLIPNPDKLQSAILKSWVN